MSSTRAKQPFSGSGAFELSGGKFARIKLPSDMLPLIRGGQDGWFTIDELFMNDREITGVVRINALNKLKLRIDRITGGITLNGSHGEFTGKCDRVDPEAKPKF